MVFRRFKHAFGVLLSQSQALIPPPLDGVADPLHPVPVVHAVPLDQELVLGERFLVSYEELEGSGVRGLVVHEGVVRELRLG